MKFVFQYPDFHGLDGDMLDAGDVGDLATRAENAGWHGFAFTEHPAPSAKWLAAGG
ncbi:MAG: LLM class F420-dependent oxidoreductase, partial [Actinobacteria bacterium]|nr:LLM class F420-dependent oxidoreductase [Actinomycetota bacterium]